MISKQLAVTIIRNHRVSTVELPGFDEGEPEKYETMVFQVSPENNWEEKDVQRYNTRREAVIGHIQMVGKWKEILQDYEMCFRCDDPANSGTIEDENEFGDTIDLPVCTNCRYELYPDEAE